MVVRERYMNVHRVARRGDGVKLGLRATGQGQGRRAAGQVDHADILHEHALVESGTDRLGEGFLGGEALGVGACARHDALLGLGALDIGEHARDELVAEPVERRLYPLDIAQVRTEPDDHDACFAAPPQRKLGSREARAPANRLKSQLSLG